MAPQVEGIRFFLPGLPETVSDDEIRQHFSRYGQLTEAAAAKDKSGQHRGFGYITFNPAISPDPLLNDVHEIGGSDVRVVMTKESLAGSEVKKVHLSHCSHLSVDEIRFAFSHFGQVWDVHTPKDPSTGERKWFAFVTFGTDEAYQKALAAGSLTVGESDIAIKPAAQSAGDAGGKGAGKNGKGADPWGAWDAWGWGPFGKAAGGGKGGPLGGKAPAPEQGIRYFVTNVPLAAAEEDLKGYFGTYGKVLAVTIVKDKASATSKGIAYVTMEDEKSRDTILSDSHNMGGQDLSIMLSKENLANASVEKVHVDGCQVYSLEEIRSAFSSFGPVLDVHTPKDPNTGERKFYAFVTFGTEEARSAALAAGVVAIGDSQCPIKAAARSPNAEKGSGGKNGWGGKGSEWAAWGKGADMWGGKGDAWGKGGMWSGKGDSWSMSMWGGKGAGPWGKGAKGDGAWGGMDSWGYGGYDGAFESYGYAGMGGDAWGKTGAGKGQKGAAAWGGAGAYGAAKGACFGRLGPY